MFLIACNSTLRLTCVTCVNDYILWPTGFMVTMLCRRVRSVMNINKISSLLSEKGKQMQGYKQTETISLTRWQHDLSYEEDGVYGSIHRFVHTVLRRTSTVVNFNDATELRFCQLVSKRTWRRWYDNDYDDDFTACNTTLLPDRNIK